MIKSRLTRTEKKPIKIKCVTLGDSGVGKTSFVKRLLGYDFINNQESTLGATFIENSVIIDDDEDKTIKVQFWDTAGQERYRSLAPMYIRGANIAFVVCDITDRQSYINLNFWIDSVINNSFEADISVIINKLDLKNTVNYPITDEDIVIKLSQYKINHYFISAKTSENIEVIKEKIIEKCREKYDKTHKKNNPIKSIFKNTSATKDETQDNKTDDSLTSKGNIQEDTKINLDEQNYISSQANYYYNKCCY